MALSKLGPVSSQVPLIDPTTGKPTPYFQRLLQVLLEEKQDTEDQTQENVTDIQDLADTVSNLELDDLSDVDLTSVAQGDLLYRSGGNEWVNLPAGSSGQFLKTNGAAANPSWASLASGSTAWTLIKTDGTAQSTSLGTATVTIASPGVFTLTAHGLVANAPIRINTTGALPTGLTAGGLYFVRNPTANTFEVSATSGGASINTSGTQSGTHTITPVYTWTWSTNVSNVDVTGLANYNELLIFVRGVTTSASATRAIRASVDNGASFFSTSGQYAIFDVDGTETASTAWGGHSTASTAARSFICHCVSLKGPWPMCISHTSSGISRFFLGSMKDINAIQLCLSAAANMTAGYMAVFAR